MPSSSMVSAITAAPNFFASRNRSLAAASPSSKTDRLTPGSPVAATASR